MGIRARMLLFFGGAVAITLIASTFFTFFGIPFTRIKGSYRIHRDEVILHVNNLAELKHVELERWFEERINQIKVFAEGISIATIADQFDSGMARGEGKNILLKEIRKSKEYTYLLQRAQAVQTHYVDYAEILIVDIKTGLVIFSTDEGKIGSDLSEDEGIRNSALPGVAERVYFKKEGLNDAKKLQIVYPITRHSPSTEEEYPSLAIMFVVNSERFLIPVLHAGSGLGQSGEIELIDMNQIILTPLKYLLPGNRRAEPLEYKLDTKAAELAAWGIDGVVMANDYRGIPAIAAIRHLRITSEFGIGLIAKIDEEEVFNFARQGLRNSLYVSGMGLVFLLWLIYVFSQRIALPVTQLSRTAQKVMAGNLSERSALNTADEVGLLAGSFNAMVEKLQQWQQNLELQVKERTAELAESNAHFYAIFNESPNALVEEDFSAVKARIDQLRESGITDLRSYLNENPAEVAVLADLVKIVQFNRAAAELFGGKSLAQVAGGLASLCADESFSVFKEEILVLAEGRTHFEMESSLLNSVVKNGFFQINISVQSDFTETLSRILISFIDITKRKLAEEKLLRSKEVLRIFVEHSPASIAMFDCDMKYLVASHRFLVDYNLGHQDIIGRSHYEVFPEISERWREIHRRCLAGAVEKAENDLFPRSDGTEDWVRWEIRPWYENQGEIGGIILFSEVITERKKIEIELDRHREHLEELVLNRTAALDKNQLAMMNLVEDLHSKTAALQNANERLQGLDRLKSMFIASMSHELRTPLNSIIGFSSILKEEWLGPVNPEQKENLANILDSGKHLLSLINEVIDLSKVEAGMLESVKETFNLKAVVSEAVTAVRHDADAKGVSLGVDVSVVEMLYTDRRRLLQCLLNLLANAVKFTDQGEIVVTAYPVDHGDNGSWVEIAVRDSGIGIRFEDIDKLFKPFVRLHPPGQAQYPGTGLGLYLMAKLTREVLGGEVTVSSEFGKGSVFCLRIPVMHANGNIESDING